MIFFKELHKVLDRAITIDEDKAWFFSIDAFVKSNILNLNKIDQLFNNGVDSLNQSLGEYSPYTIELKKSKGQRVANITLKDTGEFYDSFFIVVRKDEIIIGGDSIKEDGTDLVEEFGSEIYGLTPENTERVSRLIAIRYIAFIKKELKLFNL